MFQFIHAADIHLDSPLKGLAHFDGAPVERIRSATRDAFRNLIQLALDERVAFVLIAGDLWDCDWPDAGPGLFFISQAARLDKAGIPIFLVKGNHDAQSQLTSAIRNWPKNVTMFAHRKPKTVWLEQWNVAIHGQSYAQQHVMEDLSLRYPVPIPGAFNIGMLHTSLEDGGTEYAPACLEKLLAQGYDYWALGHIHDRRDLSRDGVHIEYPGNLQGRSIRETGPKGCTLVTVADDHSVATRFEPLDVVRWQELEIQAGETEVETTVRNALTRTISDNGGRLLAVRLRIAGELIPDQALRDRLDAVAVEVGDVWIEKILIERPVTSDHNGTHGKSMIDAEIQQVLAEAAAGAGTASQWLQDLARLRSQLSGELAEGEAAHILNDEQAFRNLVARIGEEL
jgi:exonuclease SbcD